MKETVIFALIFVLGMFLTRMIGHTVHHEELKFWDDAQIVKEACEIKFKRECHIKISAIPEPIK